MHRSPRTAAREVVLKRLQCFADLAMFEEKNRYTGCENETPDSIVEAPHASQPISFALHVAKSIATIGTCLVVSFPRHAASARLCFSGPVWPNGYSFEAAHLKLE